MYIPHHADTHARLACGSPPCARMVANMRVPTQLKATICQVTLTASSLTVFFRKKCHQFKIVFKQDWLPRKCARVHMSYSCRCFAENERAEASGSFRSQINSNGLQKIVFHLEMKRGAGKTWARASSSAVRLSCPVRPRDNPSSLPVLDDSVVS